MDTDRRRALSDHDTAQDNVDDASAVLHAAIAGKHKGATPRNGQKALCDKMAAVMTGGSGPYAKHHVGEAGVGIGKSFVGLANAAVRAVKHGERTVYSTKTINLQEQIIKDVPGFVEATRTVLGAEFTVAVLKGYSNYICPRKVVEAGNAILKDHMTKPGLPQKMVNRGLDIAEMKPTPHTIALLTPRVRQAPALGSVDVDGGRRDLITLKPVVDWALGEVLDPSADGAKTSFNGKKDDWDAVSISSDDCVSQKCPVQDLCKPLRAREVAGNADLVVTNHAFLGIQASDGHPIILGHKTVGQFDHLIIDEAHSLMEDVRSRGGQTFSVSRVKSASSAALTTLSDKDGSARAWTSEGADLAATLATELEHAYAVYGGKKWKGKRLMAAIPQRLNPASATLDKILSWADEGSRLLAANAAANKKIDDDYLMRNASSEAVLTSLRDDLEVVQDSSAGWLRLIERNSNTTKGDEVVSFMLQRRPVVVSGLMRENLWSQTSKEGQDISPTVTCISGTIPDDFAEEAGMRFAGAPIKYELPFDDAYKESWLYIPKATTAADVEALSDGGKFSTDRHVVWALEKMKVLVEASGGRALILAATGGGVKAYASGLEAHSRGRWNVYRDAPGTDAVKRWQKDKTGVLVGTRGLMTGVDAPGDTCVLVILDRVPRNPPNPMDDARVEARRSSDVTKQQAVDKVFVSDAASLLLQSRGRLVRHEDDRGVFAVLDPRILKGEFSSDEAPSRQMYLRTLDILEQRTSNIDVITEYLRKLKLPTKSALPAPAVAEPDDGPLHDGEHDEFDHSDECEDCTLYDDYERAVERDD